VAARIAAEPGTEVETVHGGPGEFSARVDDRVVYDGSRFWYPWPGSVLARVREALGAG